MNIRLLKLLFCFFLFFFFLFIFGAPAVERYLVGNVVFRDTKMEPQHLELPAITVCVDAVCTYVELREKIYWIKCFREMHGKWKLIYYRQPT